MEETTDYQVENQVYEPVTSPVQATETLGDSGKKALEAERKRAKELEQQLKQFKGIDPNRYQELLAIEEQRKKEQQELEIKNLEEKKKFDEIIALKEKQFQEAIAKEQAEKERIKLEKEQSEQNYRQKEMESVFLNKLGAKCIGSELLLERFGKRLITEDGEIKIQSGNTTIPLNEFIESQIKTDYSYCFESAIANGTGLTPGSGSSKPMTNGMSAEEFLKLSANQQFELANKKIK